LLFPIFEEKQKMTEQTFYRYNPWWESDVRSDNFIEREKILTILKSYLRSKQIVFLTGLRRVGKTTCMKMLINHLIANAGINPAKILYLSLDDYLLKDKSIIELVEEYRKIMKISFSEKIFLFLDEVAYKKDFEIQLKNLYDSQNVKIYASSSSASILKSRKSFLTGRNIVVEILPLDFEEYLLFKNISLKKSDNHLLDVHFEDYLKVGGIPEYVLNNDISYLKELIDDIIVKDISSFYNVKSTSILKDFYILLMERAGKSLSINKMSKILNISPDSARRYLNMFEDTFLIYLVDRWGKPNDKVLAPKKIYSADIGLRNYITGFKDKGSIFENYVFLKIKSLNPKYVYESEIEIDFITENKVLIESKYGSEMTLKQKQLFEKTKAKKKIIISGYRDVMDLL
jgi:hypothetical protein